RHSGPNILDLRQQGEAVHARELDVADDSVVVDLADAIQCVQRRLGGIDLDAGHRQAPALGKRLEQPVVLVHDENPRVHSPASSASNGNSSSKIAPFPDRLRTVIWPPCSCTMLYAIESPRPLPEPSSFVLKNGSKMRCSGPGSMPAPG